MRRMGWFYVSMALILCAWVLLPIYLLTILSFTERQEVFAWPKTFWPQTISLETLRFFFGVQGVWKALGNSVLVASLTVVFALALGAPAGYALARYKFPGKDAYRVLILITRAFPIMILAVPLAVRFIDLGIYDTPFAVALVHTALALPFAALITSSITSLERSLQRLLGSGTATKRVSSCRARSASARLIAGSRRSIAPVRSSAKLVPSRKLKSVRPKCSDRTSASESCTPVRRQRASMLTMRSSPRPSSMIGMSMSLRSER